MSIGLRHMLSLGALAALTLGCASVPSAPAMAVTRAALTGHWVLSHVGSHRVPKGLTLTFNADGSLAGTVGCNSMSGRYELRPNCIVIVDEIITVAGCPPPRSGLIDRAERTLFLPTAVAFLSGDGERLYIRGPDTLQFRRTVRHGR